MKVKKGEKRYRLNDISALKGTIVHREVTGATFSFCYVWLYYTMLKMLCLDYDILIHLICLYVFQIEVLSFIKEKKRGD